MSFNLSAQDKSYWMCFNFSVEKQSDATDLVSAVDMLMNAEEMPNGEGVKPLFAVGGVEQYPIPLTGVLHLDTIDETYAITVRQSSVDTGVLELHSIPMPMFFDRSDHIVEMNWPDGPDPFGYNSAPELNF